MTFSIDVPYRRSNVTIVQTSGKASLAQRSRNVVIDNHTFPWSAPDTWPLLFGHFRLDYLRFHKSLAVDCVGLSTGITYYLNTGLYCYSDPAYTRHFAKVSKLIQRLHGSHAIICGYRLAQWSATPPWYFQTLLGVLWQAKISMECYATHLSLWRAAIYVTERSDNCH